MKPIVPGQVGPAVEDVQARLGKLGYTLDETELLTSTFGPTTAVAVRTFRSRQGLPLEDSVDEAAWIELVDETYVMGDRTLYLRLPYFRGADVSHLQMTLNVLGFSCGEVDGLYGPHTEAAVREFQSNVGLMADGCAFQDTFDAIDRLHHVWSGKTASAEFSMAHMSLARAADVLERCSIFIGATDPIARNVAGRVWNVACATTDEANVVLMGSLEDDGHPDFSGADLVLIVATAPLAASEELPNGTVNIVADGAQALTQRLAAAVTALTQRPRVVRAELAHLNRYDGTVTNRVVQSTAIMVLDAVCTVLAPQ